MSRLGIFIKSLYTVSYTKNYSVCTGYPFYITHTRCRSYFGVPWKGRVTSMRGFGGAVVSVVDCELWSKIG